MSRNSRAYAERHLALLKVFLNWEAEISYSLEFGDTTAKYQVHDRPHPTDKALKELTRTKVIKLQRIRYKTSKIGTLGGIQLEFANMTGSAFYQTSETGFNFRTVDIDTSRTIDKVSMKTTSKTGDEDEVQITAMKFTDKDDGNILDLNFSNDEPRGTWTTYQIPLGHEIVGLRAKKDKGQGLRRLGLLLWIPNPED